MLQVILGLIGALLGVSGAFLYQYFSGVNAKALLANKDTTDKVAKINTKIDANNAEIASAQQAVKQAEEDLAKKQAVPGTPDNLLQFLNGDKK